MLCSRVLPWYLKESPVSSIAKVRMELFVTNTPSEASPIWEFFIVQAV